MIDVLVIGAINVDLVTHVERRPAGGETVLGSRLERRGGGKGANQAAAAARAGARTGLISAVGDDADGSAQLAALTAAGVDLTGVLVDPEHDTGAALIMITPDAENSIVVVAGAAQQLTVEQVDAAFDSLGPTRVVVGQTEVPAAAIDAAARRCTAMDARFVLNDAPVLALAAETLRRADPLVVNEHEAADIAGVATDLDDDALAAAVLAHTGARSVVVTLGARGAVRAAGGRTQRAPARPAEAVDTTGAGDAFVGTLAASLASGADDLTAVQTAIVAAADAVTWRGARPDR